MTEFNARRELRQLLDWWIEHLQDRTSGGYHGRCSNDNIVNTAAERGVVMNARILWTFSAAARATDEPRYRLAAEHAYLYIQKHFFDQEHGGYYWMLSSEGNALDKKKQVYAQAFVIYGLSEYYLLSKNEAVKKHALAAFGLLEQHGRDLEANGYIEAFAGDWSELADVRLSEKDLNATKTMNTHLHVLEAYTNLYRIEPTAIVKEALQNLVVLFHDKFIDADRHHLRLFFDTKWNHLDKIDSYGHDIECSWLLVEAAEVLGDAVLLEKSKQLAVDMARVALQEGMDTDGAMYNERDGDHLDDDKHWWPQAEAVVGYYNAYQLSADNQYLKAASRTLEFIRTLLYTGDGEWYWRADQKGVVALAEDKAGPWKAPYHSGRMYLELMHRKASL